MLEFEHVDVAVSHTPILSDLSISFEERAITTIVGPNGCGKTTLLQTLNGISTVTKGRVQIDGEDFFALNHRQRARRLSFMASFRESVPNISVKGLVEHGRFPYMGFSRQMGEADKAAVQRAIEYTHLEEYVRKSVSELSGGLQQRVYLAMQLAQDCPYMVMDEPINYLDYPSQREMYQLIRELGNMGKTVILVLHDLNQALRISDQLVVMANRKIVGGGTPQECLKSRILEGVFDCEIQELEIKGEKQYLLL